MIEARVERAEERPTRPAARPAPGWLKSPLFWSVLALKLLLGAFLGSHYMRELFVPFTNYFVGSGFADPWAHFAGEGRFDAFPYPAAMLALLAIPRFLLGPFMAAGVDVVTPMHLFAARLPLILADLGIFLGLMRWFPAKSREVLFYYWCSPILLYVCYWHGQLDVLPTALFFGALVLYRQHAGVPASLLLGLSLAAKSHLWAALPFLFTYLYQEHKWKALLRFLPLALGTYALVNAPFWGSDAFWAMVFGNEEQKRLFSFQLVVGQSQSVALMLAPVAMVVLWFHFHAQQKRNWDLLMLYLALLFGVFTLLTPPAPGYFLWSLPFLVYLVCLAPRFDGLPFTIYALCYLGYYMLAAPAGVDDVLMSLLTPGQGQAIMALREALPANLIYSFMQASFLVLVVTTFRAAVASNQIYRARVRPVLVGISGDSGSGKDTFTRLIGGMFEAEKTATITGDDYHRWERGHDKWKVYTHLDVRANDLHRQYHDAIALLNGQTIYKVTYDHDTGKFTEKAPFFPNELVFIQGLHSLSLEGLRTIYDLKVFLDPDDDLRRRWKIQRDVVERGHQLDHVLKALEQRERDRERYIMPQRPHADLVVRWYQEGEGGALGLEIQARNSFHLQPLVERLAEAPGLRLDLEPFLDADFQRLHVTGSVDASVLAAAAAALIPNMEELGATGRFQPQLEGVLQLVFLSCLSEGLRLRPASGGPAANGLLTGPAPAL